MILSEMQNETLFPLAADKIFFGRIGGRGRVDGHLGIHRSGGPLTGETHLRLVGHRTDHVAQLGVLSNHTNERLPDNIQEGGFDVLLEEEGRDLDGQLGVLQRDGTDRAEPYLKLLRLDVLLNDAQTVVPDFNMSLLRIHSVVHNATN